MEIENIPLDISFIVVSWNAKKYLYECLSSVVKEAANYKSEIIVVDNASSDGAPEMVCERFPRVRLIENNENLGFAKANNIGIKESRGKYLVLLNSDVEVLPGCIALMLDYMERQEKIGILGPQVLDLSGGVQRSCMGFPTLWNSFCRAFALDTIFPKSRFFGQYLMTYWPHDSTREVDIINGCFWIVRRKALELVGPLDERFFIYGEDKDWCRRFWDAGWTVVYFHNAQVVHYGGASSSSAPVKFFIEMNRANLKYWSKHRGRLGQACFFVMMLLQHLIRYSASVVQYLMLPSKRSEAGFKIERSAALIRWLLSFDMNKKCTL